MHGAGLSGWRLQLLGAAGAGCREPACVGARELAVDAAGHAAAPAAHGLLAGPAAGEPHAGRGPVAAQHADRTSTSCWTRWKCASSATRTRNLLFGLLTDFCDADQAEAARKTGCCSRRRANGIERLNAKYRSAGRPPFFLFHRPRRWNPREQAWMGHERKRGKLADLNLLLRGAGHDRFSLVVGDVSRLPDVRYVITLDTDTQLPRDAARQLVGVMAHPLNRPRFDERKRRVVRRLRHPAATHGGDACRAPVARGTPSCSAANRASIPYTRSVSDVYQDLFGEGSFIGKGIYDVDAFERALQGALSRQPHPQPRPARGLLRALGTAERRAAVRGLSGALRERCPPP